LKNKYIIKFLNLGEKIRFLDRGDRFKYFTVVSVIL